MDAEEAEERLAAVRSYLPERDLVLFFELLERKSGNAPERRIGILEAGSDGAAQVLRLTLVAKPSSNQPELAVFPVLAEWRMRGGSEPRVEVATPEGFREVPVEAWSDPLVEGFSHSAFDLVMPYLFWEDVDYEGPERVSGRSAHLFRMKRPEVGSGLAKGSPVRSVRLVLDKRFNAPLAMEYLDAADEVVRAVRVVSLKEVDGIWTVGNLEVRDYAVGNRSQLGLVGGGAVPSVSGILLLPPRDEVRIPFAELGLEWF